MQAPYCLAMVVCDGIHRDPGTGKWTILGTFSVLAAKAFPAKHPIIAIYLAMTDGRGKTPLKIDLVTADEQDTIGEVEIEANFADPRAVIEGVMAFRDVEFPRPGEYRFRLHANGEYLMERRLVVLSIEQGENNAKPSHD